jgi:exodeoxyribonuclease-3
MRLVTWNINSIRPRTHLIEQLRNALDPDVVCLQEIKVEDGLFPSAAMTALGYPHLAVFGMRSYHGVAVLSRLPLAKVARHHWCDKEDTRHLEVHLPGGIELHNLYIPAGGDEPDPEVNDKFAHKLRFFDEQTDWWAERRAPKARRILVGDLNVAPLETDVWSHKQLLKVVSHTPVEVERYGRMFDAFGGIDAVREVVPAEQKLYSWWSYRARDWRAADKGRRLDHVWLSPALHPALDDAFVLKDARGWEKASDHAPVVVDLKL